ncbi:retrograde regulation protein 2 [Xylogone sp. PMI_703]|nr:retrograde regulation protein 2 [Xylogone sp. PMI_703]
MAVQQEKKAETDTKHLEQAIDAIPKKPISTAYVTDSSSDPHRKSAAERRLILKCDLVIVPLAALIYFAAYLDRNSIGNAKIMGLVNDLRMSAQGYYNCATMFYVGYIILMLPGNICLRYVLPHMQLGGIACMAAAHNYHTILALRILVGAAQAFIQGLGLYVTLWYKRDEVATRGAIYYSASTISGAYSGLIAYGVQSDLTMSATGRGPWRWLFIIEGVIGLTVGILTWLLLPRFPDKIKSGKSWLFTKEEVDLAMARLASYNTIGAKVEMWQILVTLKDPKSWAFALVNSGVALGISSIGVFLPTFILFSVIPYAFATVALLIACVASDRLNTKGPILFFCLVLSSIGYIMLLTVSHPATKIVATCFITSGLYPAVVLLATWLGINTGGFTKRGTTWAMAEIFGQCFSIMGSNIYTGGPRYIKGHSTVLGFLVMAMISTAALHFWMRHLNKKRDLEEAQYALQNEIHPHASCSLEEVFDFHVSFRHIL